MKRLLVVLAACHPAPTPATPTIHATAAIVDVTVVPMDAERELPHQTVLVDGDHIVAIGSNLAVPSGATQIDGRGKWLIPGLVDMHVHYNDEGDGLLYVANGVTTVRNMWGFPETLAWRTKSRANEAGWIAPTIYTAGSIVDGDPPSWQGSHVALTAEAGTAEVDAQVADGYELIKVYDDLPLAAYDAIVAEAAKKHVRVVGHVPMEVGLEHALASKQATIEHFSGYLLAAQDRPVSKGDLSMADVMAHVDPAKLAPLAKKTRDAGTAVVPTLVVLSRIASFDNVPALMALPENQYVAPALLASWDPSHDFRFHDITPEQVAAFRKGNEYRRQLLVAMDAAGTDVFVGTDTPNPFVVPGFSVHEELRLFVEAGLSPYHALRDATSAPAKWLGDAAGTIKVGARADLVLLEADPLRDITATQRRAGVMVRGRWHPAADLDAKLTARKASLQARQP